MESWERALAFVGAASAAGPPLERSLDVTIHFHPDRLYRGVPLLSHLASDRIYRSQFETRTSNGGLTAYPGGQRWEWEHRVFGGHYDNAPPSERPKYGSLNYRRHPAGGSVRFGSSHFRLSVDALDRVSFCYPDSSANPTSFGAASRMSLIRLAQNDHLDLIDDHIEAHIHGPLRLDRDVSAIVLDPSFQGTPVEDAAGRLSIPVLWHHGFRLHVDDLQKQHEYRGDDVAELGVQVAPVDGWLDPRIIGDAAGQGEHDPQMLKQLWHCVARFGHDWTSEARPAPRP